MHYYNENDLPTAYWLRELISEGHLPPGDVDTRSIEDVEPEDLHGYTSHHFFAGIGGWPLALRAAGWPDDRPIWTGSCPCQPFSEAGEGKGFADERHLWPAFHWLISKYRPTVVVGEQVSSKSTDPWVDLVQSDLEGLGYAFGCLAFPAAGVGAPQIRDRLYWVGNADHKGLQGRGSPERQSKRQERPIAARGTPPALGSVWGGAEWSRCGDGRVRPVGPVPLSVASRIPARVVRLRGYGNALNIGSAMAFIEEALLADER